MLLQAFKEKPQSWWKSPVASLLQATNSLKGGENACVISACLTTQVDVVTSWFEAKNYLIILNLKEMVV